MRAIKKDKYFRDKGGVFKILQISCAKCGKEVMLYQKDGRGALHRSYLNRILAPEHLASLQDKIKSQDQLEAIICECGNVIAKPMKHREGRIAFWLILGTYRKQLYKKDK